MGFTGKKKSPLQMMDNGGGGFVDSESKKWVFGGGIGLRSHHLKPIFTTNPKKDLGYDDDDEDDCCTTPTSDDSRIMSSRLPCPPAPKKRKSTSSCHFNGVREFFNPPDLETVFIRRAEKA